MRSTEDSQKRNGAGAIACVSYLCINMLVLARATVQVYNHFFCEVFLKVGASGYLSPRAVLKENKTAMIPRR